MLYILQKVSILRNLENIDLVLFLIDAVDSTMITVKFSVKHAATQELFNYFP
jgi:predicted membrane GTPase involved in stress response